MQRNSVAAACCASRTPALRSIWRLCGATLAPEAANHGEGAAARRGTRVHTRDSTPSTVACLAPSPRLQLNTSCRAYGGLVSRSPKTTPTAASIRADPDACCVFVKEIAAPAPSMTRAAATGSRAGNSRPSSWWSRPSLWPPARRWHERARPRLIRLDGRTPCRGCGHALRPCEPAPDFHGDNAALVRPMTPGHSLPSGPSTRRRQTMPDKPKRRRKRSTRPIITDIPQSPWDVPLAIWTDSCSAAAWRCTPNWATWACPCARWRRTPKWRWPDPVAAAAIARAAVAVRFRHRVARGTGAG